MSQAVVGLDIGTSGVKAVAVSASGDVLSEAERGYQLSNPCSGWAEQDPEDWWRSAEEALAALGVEPTAIGLSGQMHSLVCLDKRLRVLRPAILWNDQRTGTQCAEIEARIGAQRLIGLAGNRALPGFTAPKLLWLRDHEPEVYRQIAHILLPKDYVRLRLTGELATDVSDASGTLLFDVAERRWSQEIVASLDIDPAWLPRAAESMEVTGETANGVPVAAGAGDQAASAIGVGVTQPGPLSIVVGTSGVVFAPLAHFACDQQGRVHAFCHAIPGRWHMMGVMLSAAGSLAWLQQTFAAPYETLLNEAAAVPPGSDGVQFAPYLSGERTPHVDPDIRGAFTGLSIGHGRGVLVRALLEGVAFGLRDSLELIRDVGAIAQTARVSGGGAQSALWRQIIASALDVPLQRTQSDAGAAHGAAILAAVAAGALPDVDSAAASWLRVTETTEPDPVWTATYLDAYRRYSRLYPALREITQPEGSDRPEPPVPAEH